VLALRVGQTARLTIDGSAQPVAARVVRINPGTQAGTRAVMAYLALEPLPGLRQGLFARGPVELQRAAALVVPASALRSDQARPYVLLVAEGRITRRTVTAGAEGEALVDGVPEAVVEISAGLQPGDRVLRGTVGTLRDGTPVRLAAPAQAPSAARALSAHSGRPGPAAPCGSRASPSATRCWPRWSCWPSWCWGCSATSGCRSTSSRTSTSRPSSCR
jgi:membrane fusion protein, multidrug efflux system